MSLIIKTNTDTYATPDGSLQYGIPIDTKNLSNSVGINYEFKRKDLMEEGDIPFSITYAVGYALSNSHHSVEYRHLDRIHINELFASTSTQ